jgi:hypothetical protein
MPNKKSKVKINKEEQIFLSLCKSIAWFLVTLLTYLGYITEIRPHFAIMFGAYFLGLLDGIVLSLTIVVLCFYSYFVLCRK